MVEMELETVFILILLISSIMTSCALFARLRRINEKEGKWKFSAGQADSKSDIRNLSTIDKQINNVHLTVLPQKQQYSGKCDPNMTLEIIVFVILFVSFLCYFCGLPIEVTRARSRLMHGNASSNARGVENLATSISIEEGAAAQIPPPPYDYMEPPPKYEDVIKISVIQVQSEMPAVHQPVSSNSERPPAY